MFLRCGTKRRNDRIRPFIRFPDDGAPSVRDGGCGAVGLCEELHSATKTRKTAIASGSDEVVPWRRRTVVGYGPCGNDACRWAPESGMRLCRMSKVPSGKRRRCPKGGVFLRSLSLVLRETVAVGRDAYRFRHAEAVFTVAGTVGPISRVLSIATEGTQLPKPKLCGPVSGGVAVFAVGGTLVDGSGRRCFLPQRLWTDDIR